MRNKFAMSCLDVLVLGHKLELKYAMSECV